MRKMAGAGRKDRLTSLADSINETARMARANVSLTLIGALYLALTLLSAKDENLLRNSVVTLPQFEAGISLELSYLFAPVVFLYLHVQTLFLLVVLARKVRTFEKSLAQVSGADGMVKAEYRDCLSAISLVQGLLGTGRFTFGARFLAWLGTVVIPLLLLFLIDTSFLRYQSPWISLLHHICFSADLACVWMFWLRVFSGDSRSRREGNQSLVCGLKAIGKLKLAAILCSFILVVVLWLFAWPERFQPKENEDDLLSFNVFDDVLCADSLWRGFCRRLRVRGGTLLRSGSNGGQAGLLLEFDENEVDSYRRIYGLDLTNRSLRYAELENAYMPAAQLSRADMRGAKLTGATMDGANLTYARLQDAHMIRTRLRGADLTQAMLHNADLTQAGLRNADLIRAELHGANLTRAELHGADLTRAELRDADLIRAELHGADLGGWPPIWPFFEPIAADLTCANLKDAELVGTNLMYSNLQGATLNETFVVGTLGTPFTDQGTTFDDVMWNTNDLPHLDSCSNDADSNGRVACHLELREIPSDLKLAWDPDVTLRAHLLKHAKDGQSQDQPEWLLPSNAESASTNFCDKCLRQSNPRCPPTSAFEKRPLRFGWREAGDCGSCPRPPDRRDAMPP